MDTASHQATSMCAQSKKPHRPLIGAIDQGTSSTRFLAFESGTGKLIASSQIEIKRKTPREGWVEIDPREIMSTVYKTIADVRAQLSQPTSSGAHSTKFELIKCIGICNQRESTVVWDSKTGEPLYNVIVWMDNRTKEIVDKMIDKVPGRDFNHLKDKTGLPMSTYFSAFKLKWLIDNVEAVRRARDDNTLKFGTVDSWILWNLTGKHLTDVSNASRTFLMDIETLQWDKSLCKQFDIPMQILPTILSSADDFGHIQHGHLKGLPITGVIGDQSAALFGHNCLQLGQTKATFGTGCFIMQNIGHGPLHGAMSGVQREAKRGLVTTVGYKLRERPVCYALEGSIKIAGAGLTWLRDNMQLINSYEECDQLINKTQHSAGVFFVPALGGLYSPYWDPNAAGLYIGLSQFSRREHVVRATFDSIAFQTNDILSLMRGVTNGLMIDGGLCKSDNMCQILADITGCDIVRPSMCETSALGAAMVAGCGADIWPYDHMVVNSQSPFEYLASANHNNHHYPHESLHCNRNNLAEAAAAVPLGSIAIEKPQCARAAAADASGEHPLANDDSVSTMNSDALDALEDDDEDDDDEEDADLSMQHRANEQDVIAMMNQSEDVNTPSRSEHQQHQHQQQRQLAAKMSSNHQSLANFYANSSSGYSSGDQYSERLSARRESPETSPQSDLVKNDLLAATEAALAAQDQQEHVSLDDEQHGDRQHLHLHLQQAPIESISKCLRPTATAASCKDDDDDDDDIASMCAADESADETGVTDAPESTRRRRSFKHKRVVSSSHQALQEQESVSTEQSSACSSRAGCSECGHSACLGGGGGGGVHDDDNNQNKPMERMPIKPVDVFQSYISLEHRTELVNTWRQAVKRSMHWTKVHHEEVRRIDYMRLASLPLSLYIFLSIGVTAASGFFSSRAL